MKKIGIIVLSVLLVLTVLFPSKSSAKKEVISVIDSNGIPFLISFSFINNVSIPSEVQFLFILKNDGEFLFSDTSDNTKLTYTTTKLHLELVAEIKENFNLDKIIKQ